MNEKNKILSKRIELAGNGIVAAAFTGAGALLFGDVTINFENATLAMCLVLFSTILFGVITWLLMEMAKRDGADTPDDGDG